MVRGEAHSPSHWRHRLNGGHVSKLRPRERPIQGLPLKLHPGAVSRVTRRTFVPVVRHLTATGFVVHDHRVLLHWHPKVGAWLPPGGHIEENEDPVQAVLREIEEEAGVQAEVVSTGPRLDLDYPTQVEPPFTIMVEDIDDPETGFHQHIDMIYFCRLAGPAGPLNDGWMWAGLEGGYVNRCVNDIRRRPSQPLIQ